MDHPICQSREVLKKERVEIVRLRARRVARKQVAEGECLKIGESAADAANGVLREMGEGFVEPGGFELACRRTHGFVAISSVDHVLKFVGDGPAGSLTN